jgi:dTDP-4-dehydrorhamnose 3,5-epimerase
MKFEEQPIAGCYLVSLEPHEDDRGFFARAFDIDEFGQHGLEPNIVQMNVSQSRLPGTVRGIHWQAAPYSEAKLVRCVRGAIFDVCVDVRDGSPTRAHWVGAELTADNHHALYVPPGCGHAHQTLEPDTMIMYSVSAPYVPAAERGARWDDAVFGIDWPLREDIVISDKDLGWPAFHLL